MDNKTDEEDDEKMMCVPKQLKVRPPATQNNIMRSTLFIKCLLNEQFDTKISTETDKPHQTIVYSCSLRLFITPSTLLFFETIEHTKHIFVF